jgi:hypothetical protein
MQALRRAFSALGLDEEELDGLLLPVRTVLPDSQPVSHGESSAPQSSTGHRLNLDRIRQIRAETAQVQDLLHRAMAIDELSAVDSVDYEEDSEADEVAAPQVTSQDQSAALAAAPRQRVDGGAFELYGIPLRFRPFVEELIGRQHWPADALQALAQRHGVMLSAAIEVVNEWSQEQFEDWLIEEDGDVVRLQLDLLPNR